jgi:ribosomal protein L11 methylase PrmA
MAAEPEVNQDEFLACARYGELEDMLKELEKGADVNAKGSMGNTALHAACANGHEAVVKELLARGADASQANDAGNTPAHYAAQQKHAPCLRLVLTDSLQKNSFGRSTLTEAIAAGDGACATVALEHESCAEENIIEGLEKVEVDDDEDAPQTITHTLLLGEKIRIRELPIADKTTDALGDGSGATDRTGLGVWAAAVVLGRWLAEKSSDFEKKRVVELGAGCGVGALALAASCATCSVVATDAAPEALENCRHNVDLFGEDRGNSDVTHGPLKATKRVSVQALDWDAPPEPVCGRPAPPLTADSGLFYESGAMFAGGKNTASVHRRWRRPHAIGRLPHRTASPYLRRPRAGALRRRRGRGPRLFRSCCGEAVQDGRGAGLFPRLLLRAGDGPGGLAPVPRSAKALGFTRTTEDAPASYSEAPCEGAALYFPDLANSSFQLHTFTSQEPATASYQAMSYLVREDRKHGKLARGGHGKPAALPLKLRPCRRR